MSDVSLFRLYLLRATYALLVVGLGLMIWPGIVHAPADLPHMSGVVRSLLGSLSLMALVGIRHPLRMLPLLLFELVWKTIWILAFGLPARSARALSAGMRETMEACIFGVVLCVIVIPWGYVYRRYVRERGDRWGKRRAVGSA